VGAAKLVRKIHIHIDGTDGVLDFIFSIQYGNGVAEIFYADPVYVNFPVVGLALYIVQRS